MPATNEELIEFGRQLFACEVMPDTVPIWSDGTVATMEERRAALLTGAYDFRRTQDRLRAAVNGQKPIKTAYRLLRRFLTPEQRRQLQTRREFIAQGASGRYYRLCPWRNADLEEVEKHGSRYYITAKFCIHPDEREEILPNPDITLAQLLHLTTDEEDFRQRANIRVHRNTSRCC